MNAPPSTYGFGEDHTFTQFDDYCREHAIGLDERILEAGRGNTMALVEGAWDIYAASSFMRAIVTAGTLLRTNHGRPLAAKPISGDLLPDNAAARMLTDLTNAALLPASTGSAEHHFHSRGLRPASACAKSDGYFANTVERLRDTRRDALCDIYTSATGQPVFLRKGLGRWTGLALEPITIDDIPYPVGSIVRLDNEDEGWSSPRSGVYSVGDIGRVCFLRPSVFSLPPDQREDSFPDIEDHGFDDSTLTVMYTMPLEEIRQLAAANQA